MFYDDEGEAEAQSVHRVYGEQLGIPQLKHADLPHLTLPFPGAASPRNRQTPALAPRQVAVGVVGRPPWGVDARTSYVTEDYVSASLGREATDTDVDLYIQRRAGGRSMSGVVGDLFAQSTRSRRTRWPRWRSAA